MSQAPLAKGDFAPDFLARSTIGDFTFSRMAGQRNVLAFLGGTSFEPSKRALLSLLRAEGLFAAHRTRVWIVLMDRRDQEGDHAEKLTAPYPIIWDFNLDICRRFHMLQPTSDPNDLRLVMGSVALDENHRVAGVLPFNDPDSHGAAVASMVAAIPDFAAPRTIIRQSAVLIVPDVLSREQCRRLIDAYEAHGGTDSPFIVPQARGSAEAFDYSVKRRQDWWIEEESIKNELRGSLQARLLPEIKKQFNFTVSHIERYIVSRYDGETGGHFAPHRDDDQPFVAHRRFAVTLNLNSDDYEGGELRLPEYGSDLYRGETGAAIVFSCGLLHQAMPVTRGRRYAFLPFLWDQEAEALRLRNWQELGIESEPPG